MADKKRVIVIGGGAAGLMAAGTAGSRGLDVTLIEKNKGLGRKLLITGKGRCNITNIADMEEFISSVPVNGKFLYGAFYSFTNQDLLKLLTDLGLETKVERGGRVFPASDHSADVVNALKSYIQRNHVRVVRGEVDKVVSESGAVSGVKLKDGSLISGDSVIVATGGMSYSSTGSTGDGYRFARENGHTITEPKPSLVPLEIKDSWVPRAQGLSLRNVSIVAINQKEQRIFEDFGEMLFTHYGVTGPIILSASSHMRRMDRERYRIVLDLKPALSEEQLDDRVQRDFDKYSRKNYSNSLNDLLPKKLIPIIIELSGIPEDKPVNQISKAERHALVFLLKNLIMEVSGFRPLDEAIITSGGVKVKEINPSTMESKLVSGLYFAGEVIDVDAYTGGYNLQIAFSTGYAAGMNCCEE